MAGIIDTGIEISKITYNGIEVPLPDTDEAYETGKQDGIQAEYDRFWDDFQKSGTRTDYSSAFCSGWTRETFRPKYNITATGAYNMFSYFCYGSAEINLKQLLEELNVSLSFYRCSNIGALFQGANITEIGDLDFSTVTRLNGTALFSDCAKLQKIGTITIPPGQTTFANWFKNCTSLTEMRLLGTINVTGTNGFNVQWSPLSRESLMSIIDALPDKSGDTSTTWQVTVGTANLEKLTESDRDKVEAKGWILV